jgi:CHAD domain-containing protein
LLEDWGSFLVSEVPDEDQPPQALRRIIDVASERIWSAYRKVLKKGRKTDRDTSAEKLHQLRLDCKRLRYLMTFFRSLYPQEAVTPLIRELKMLQDNLGDFNDLQVQHQALLGFAEEMMATGVGPPATLMAMGQLMGQLEAQQGKERDAFRQRFRRFARQKNQRRFIRLFGPDSSNPR